MQKTYHSESTPPIHKPLLKPGQSNTFCLRRDFVSIRPPGRKNLFFLTTIHKGESCYFPYSVSKTPGRLITFQADPARGQLNLGKKQNMSISQARALTVRWQGLAPSEAITTPHSLQRKKPRLCIKLFIQNLCKWRRQWESNTLCVGWVWRQEILLQSTEQRLIVTQIHL